MVGDVEIGEGSSVWPGAVIRANRYKIRIGRHVNVQDNSVIHADEDATYGDYITIGHQALSHATVVEDHCLIGNGAIVNGYSTIRQPLADRSRRRGTGARRDPAKLACGGRAGRSQAHRHGSVTWS